RFINERFIVDVLKTGVKIGIEVPVVVGDHDKLGALVKKEDVKMVVEGLMSKEEEGEARRERAKKLGKGRKEQLKKGDDV
nr:UDP-glycosyltransferase 73E1-like [Tanacetum cinerariifolium]